MVICFSIEKHIYYIVIFKEKIDIIIMLSLANNDSKLLLNSVNNENYIFLLLSSVVGSDSIKMEP